MRRFGEDEWTEMRCKTNKISLEIKTMLILMMQEEWAQGSCVKYQEQLKEKLV